MRHSTGNDALLWPGWALALLALLASASYSSAQVITRDDARQLLVDSGLEEIRPNVWKLKNVSPEFAQRKLRLLKLKKDVPTALRILRAEIEMPKLQGKEPGFTDSPTTPEAVKKQGDATDQAGVKKPRVPPTPKRPSKEEREELSNLLTSDIFEDEFIAAKDSADKKKVLAKDLLEYAGEEPDSAIRFVLIAEAMKLYAAAEDIRLTFRAIDALCRKFPDEDPLMYKYYALKNAVEDAKPKKQKVKGAANPLAQHLNELIDLAVAKDAFGWAGKTATLGNELAAKARDRKLQQIWQDKSTALSQAKQDYEELLKAQKLLQQSPEDPTANRTVGEWYVFVKQQWPKGLPYLARGDDPDWKAIATIELKPPVDPQDQTELADLYWDLSEKLAASAEDPEKDAEPSAKMLLLQNRAVVWYQKAKPFLTGISKKRIANRIDQHKAANQPPEALEEKNDRAPAPDLKLAKQKFLAKLKPTKEDAPINPAGVRLFSQKGNVLAGKTVIPIQGKNNLYLHPYPDPGKSVVTYKLRRRYRSLTGSVGIPRIPNFFGGARSTVTWTVIRDGKAQEIFKTDRMGDRSTPFALDLTGVNELKLVTSCNGRSEGCFAFWYEPLLSPKQVSEKSALQPNRNQPPRPPQRFPNNGGGIIVVPPGVSINGGPINGGTQGTDFPRSR